MSAIAGTPNTTTMPLGLLVVATAIILGAINPPYIPAFSATSLTVEAPTTTAYTLAWRPNGPPPWGEVDQATSDDFEDVGVSASDGNRGRNQGDGRSRPSMTTTP